MTNEQRLRGGRNSALKNKAQKTGIFAPTTRATATSLGGKAAKEAGVAIFAPGMQAKGAEYSNHKRWHVRRGIVKPGCTLCSTAA
jgi:hypothetical protein